MIAILKAFVVLFDTFFQVFKRLGLKRDEKDNISDRIRSIEDRIEDKEHFAENEKEKQ